jgi:hypothetical protein
VPSAPSFEVDVPGGGEVELSEIGFEDLTNVSSISSGTLQLFVWNELEDPSVYSLAQPLDATSTTLVLNVLPTQQVGTVVQVGQELMSIQIVNQANNSYEIVRGALGSVAVSHVAGANVLHLTTSTITVPFAANFFENRSSVNYLHTVSLPDMRISSAEFVATNAIGNGTPTVYCYTSGPDGGLRTLSGGQFSLQVSGVLATQQNAAPPLTVEASHAVRDIRATVNQAPVGYDIIIDILQNGSVYCLPLTIPSTQSSSNLIDGATLAPLIENSTLSINITLNLISPPPPGSIVPGKDLTVTIRL